MPPLTLNYEASRDHAIRLSAYHSWEAAGRPPGQDLEFWLSATKSLPTQYLYSAQAIKPSQFGYEGGVSAQPPVVADLFNGPGF